eukprot:g3183.t1
MIPGREQSQPFIEHDYRDTADINTERRQKPEDTSLSPQLVIGKLNRRILGFCVGIVLLSYMDRSNLGLAANDVCKDLKLNHKQYGTGVSLFYIGYATTPVLSNILLKHFGAPSWLATILFVWGIVAGTFAFMNKPWQFYVLRLLLGLAEGGTYPGIWYYATMFYPDRYLIQPFSLTIVATYLSFPVSAPIAAGLLQLDGVFNVDGWRHLFFIEGLIPVLYSLVVYVVLPRSIENASFLNSSEKAWLISQKGSKQEQKNNEVSFWQEFKVILRTKVYWIWSLANSISMAVFHTLCF